MADWAAIREQLLGQDSDFSLPPDIQLPMMPAMVSEFSQKSSDPDFPAKKLAAIIESDTGLSCELLRYINSAAFGMRKQISSAQQAMMVLGISKTKLFLLTTGVKQAMDSRKSKLINIQNFWIANLERGLLAREVAELLGADKDIAYSAAMLQDVLLPILTNELFDQYVEFGTNEGAEAKNLYNFEREKFKWDHASAGAHVLHGWGFPDELVSCIYLHHKGLKILTDENLGKTSAAAVAVSSLIPDAIRQCPNGLKDLIQLDELWPEFDLHDIAVKIDEKFQEMSPNASNFVTLKKRVEKALAQTSE